MKIRKLHLVAALLIALFLLTRLYKINISFDFINDMGRDFLALWQWHQTGKPPLLGPQTSALPFNQSAIYFYLLYPFYLLSGQSYYASLIAYLVFYILSFMAGLYFLRHYPRLEKSLLVVFFLVTIHPQYIAQGRFIWNPSFVTPCLLAAFYSLLLYLQKESFKNTSNNLVKFQKSQRLLLMLSAFSLALATGFSYSSAPAVLAFIILLICLKRQAMLPYLRYLVASLFLVNLPTVVFELRHGFLLSKMMLFGDKLPQSGNSFTARLLDLSNYSFASTRPWVLLFVLILVLFLYLSCWKQKNYFLKISLILFFATLLITLLAPISMHPHYIFGILSLFFATISFLPWRYLLLTLCMLIGFFVKADIDANFFAPARNDLQTLTTCAQSFCQNNHQALFVANQSKHHPYHNAMEWQYLLSKAGCQVKDINTANGQASQMVVVLDDSEYTHNKTAFYELTLFGESKEIERFRCSESLELVTLEKYRN